MILSLWPLGSPTIIIDSTARTMVDDVRGAHVSKLHFWAPGTVK